MVIFFAQIIIYHNYSDNGQQKLMWGIWMKYCTRVGSKMGTQTKKLPKKRPCFSLLWIKARWTDVLIVAVFFSLVLGSSVRKTSGRLLGRIPRCFCDQLTFSMTQVLTHFLEFLKICPKMLPFFSLKWYPYVCWLRKKPNIITKYKG